MPFSNEMSSSSSTDRIPFSDLPPKVAPAGMEFHPLPSSSDPTQKDSEGNPITSFPAPTIHPFLLTPRDSSFPLRFLTPSQIEEFVNTGVLILKAEQVFSEEEKKRMLEGVNQMDQWPDQKGKYMKYYEPKKDINGVVQSGEKMLCRIENFCQYNPALNEVLNGEKMLGMCSELFGSRAILYKEKINYKLSGGDGFTPHQDVAAGWWMYGQTLHISTLVCVDPATLANGCLEVVRDSSGPSSRPLISPPWRELSSESVSKLKWEFAQTSPGDIIFFDSFVPHRSGPNRTENSRRVLYATYAMEKEGDWRDKYFADKRLSYPPDIERQEGIKYEYKV